MKHVAQSLIIPAFLMAALATVMPSPINAGVGDALQSARDSVRGKEWGIAASVLATTTLAAIVGTAIAKRYDPAEQAHRAAEYLDAASSSMRRAAENAGRSVRADATALKDSALAGTHAALDTFRNERASYGKRSFIAERGTLISLILGALTVGAGGIWLASK